MDSQPPRTIDAHLEPEPLTADQLRNLISRSLLDHEDVVVACHSVHTIYVDRLALAVEDRAGQLWRVHVLTEARR